MSADEILRESSKVFRKLDKSMSVRNDSETIRKVHQDLEKRLGPRKTNSVAQFNLSEIKQVADIVDELLNKNGLKMTSAESRVAPAPAVKRQQLYEQAPLSALPRIPSGRRLSSHRNGSIQSDHDPLRGIYTLPSMDHPDPKSPKAATENSKNIQENSHYFSGKIVANLLILIQIGLILLFAIFMEYEEEHVNAVSKSYIEAQKPTQRPNYDNSFYDPNRNNYERDQDRERFNNNDNEESKYGNGAGPRFQPVTTMEQELGQRLPKYYYCK